MSLGGLFGGQPKVDTSALEAQKKEAQKAAAQARKDAEEAKKQQKAVQDEQIKDNKDRRARAANRFSLLLFDEEGDGQSTFGG